MATYVYDDAYLMINSVDLSDHVESCTTTYDAEMVDDTAMGDTWREFKAGLLNGSITVNFKQDHAASNVDATIWAAFIARTAVAVIFKPNGSATAVTNPKWTGNVQIASYQPAGGDVGGDAVAPVTLQWTGTVTRATSD